VECARAFSFFDKDGGGYIDLDEVKMALATGDTKASAPALALFDKLDVDHSGLVSLKEFLFGMVEWSGVDDDE
jgi:Ca2+-binding EF-hand superfamily protein